MPRQGYGPVTRSSTALGASELIGGFPVKSRAASGKRKEEESKVCSTSRFLIVCRLSAHMASHLLTEKHNKRGPKLSLKSLARSMTAARLSQADGGIKKGRAAFGDLTNHSQEQNGALADKV